MIQDKAIGPCGPGSTCRRDRVTTLIGVAGNHRI